jgi:hypothetical protein
MPDSNGPGQVRAKTVARIWDRGPLRAAVGRCQPDSAMLSAFCNGETDQRGHLAVVGRAAGLIPGPHLIAAAPGRLGADGG